MKDLQKLKELLVDKLDLANVMLKYNVKFAFDPHLADEVQYKCPIHGKDSKPSARLYAKTKSCYCWVCRKAWDVVTFTKDMEKFTLPETLNYLVNRYKVDISSIPDGPSLDFYVTKVDEKTVLEKQVKLGLIELRKKIPFEKYRALCGAFFMIKFEMSKGADAILSLNKIQDKILCLKQ
jgi:hypothetical protein